MTPEERIDRSFEGLLSESEWKTLQEELLRDEELRAIYVQRRWLHSQLHVDREILPALLIEEPSAPRRRYLPWIAAAAGITIATISFFLPPDSSAPVVATLIEARDCRWEGSDLPTNEGASLTTGTLALAEGLATIRFESGATVTLEAPTTLQVDSAMRCRLIEGSVVADIPESAHGFTIDTEKLEVVDLGTRFGVTSSPVAGAHVFVFDGEVTVREAGDEEARHVLGGRSVHYGADPVPEGEEVNRSQAPPTLDENWSAISTAVGRGKDAYIRSGDRHGPTGKQPLLMVKHTDIAKDNRRRILLSFDLAGLKPTEIDHLALSLQIEASGLGFSALIPDSEFTIFGALDPRFDDWEEGSLLWRNSPDLTTSTPPEHDFLPLAKFSLSKGAPNGPIEIESDELTAFVSQKAGDMATFLIIRTTGEFDKQGLVHAFASKEHPSAHAPTLWIRHPETK